MPQYAKISFDHIQKFKGSKLVLHKKYELLKNNIISRCPNFDIEKLLPELIEKLKDNLLVEIGRRNFEMRIRRSTLQKTAGMKSDIELKIIWNKVRLNLITN